MMYLRREGPKTDLGGSLLETKDGKTIVNITTLSVSIQKGPYLANTIQRDTEKKKVVSLAVESPTEI